MFAVDLHTHSCLSPCAELDMHPAGLVAAALRAGLDAVALCDHNSAENAAAARRAASGAGLEVIPGMEITSEEEVHVLGLFPDMESAFAMQSRVYRSLPGRNREGVFGMQVVADEFAQVLGFNERLLSGATSMSIEKVVSSIHEFDGLAVAAHVDRERFGVIGQLGFIPPGLPLDGLELSARTPLPLGRARYAPRDEYSLLCNSDAHDPKDVARALSFLLLQAPTLQELRKALADADGRMILGGGRPMEDLALHVLDIAQNSIEAGATEIDIELTEDPERDQMVIEVRDNGRGMNPESVARATDPFYTSRGTRRVGLGLPLLAEAARAAGGSVSIDSVPGKGTRVEAVFGYRHIDRAPVGDMETTLMVLFACRPDLRVRFRHRISAELFEIDSSELREAGIDPRTPEGLSALRTVIRQGEADLNKSQ